MEPGIFCTIPFALFFFWLGWLLLKQLKLNIKSGGFQLGGGDSSDVTYIKRDKNPIVFHFFNSLCCVFVCMFFFAGLFFLFFLFSESLGWLSDWLRIKELAD
jgi:hypothetical protein